MNKNKNRNKGKDKNRDGDRDTDWDHILGGLNEDQVEQGQQRVHMGFPAGHTPDRT